MGKKKMEPSELSSFSGQNLTVFKMIETKWCVANRDALFPPKVCVTKLSILDIFRGTRELTTPNHSSLLCACCHSMMWWCFSSMVSLRDAGLVWQAPAWGARGLASGRLQHRLGSQQGDRVLFRESPPTGYRVENGKLYPPRCKDTTGLGFSSPAIFSTAFFATALSLGGSFGMGVGTETSFSFAFINNHIEAWAMEIVFLSTHLKTVHNPTHFNIHENVVWCSLLCCLHLLIFKKLCYE